MSPRYAIYYTPPAEDPLTRLAAAWLGRDAFTGSALTRPSLPGLEGLDLDAVTKDPRGYGFHATLKAPFELASASKEQALLEFAETFAAGRRPFMAAIAPAALGRFLAFRLVDASPDMHALHEACVRAFDPFRAPIAVGDIERRRKAPLTADQDAKLLAWGYPYVFDDFRFHMTLTTAVSDAVISEKLLAALRAYFDPLAGAHWFGGVGVYKQVDRAAPFCVLARFDFRAPDQQAAV